MKMERAQPRPAAMIDVLPTICEALGIKTAPECPPDGESILDLLKGNPVQGHGPIWFFDGFALNAVRNGRWKLHRRRQSWGGDRFGQWSLPQLFDVERDPGEAYDLSSRHPEVVKQMMTLMEEFEAELPVEDPVVEWWR